MSTYSSPKPLGKALHTKAQRDYWKQKEVAAIKKIVASWPEWKRKWKV